MATPHIGAERGQFAKTVLMPGDPLRAKFIAETFLENPELVTSVRNVLGYTGTYHGKPVSVMASGMGMPSIGIYSYELFNEYGVENIIRIGSSGSYSEDLHIYDVVMATKAYSESTYALTQNGDTSDYQYPSEELNNKLREAAKNLNIPLSDVIDAWKFWKNKNIIKNPHLTFTNLHRGYTSFCNGKSWCRYYNLHGYFKRWCYARNQPCLV